MTCRLWFVSGALDIHFVPLYWWWDCRQLFLRSGGLPFSSNLRKTWICLSWRSLPLRTNPGDLTVDKIKVLKKSAVNRVSLGVQTFGDNTCVKWSQSQSGWIYESDSLKAAGFHNISIDLIYALPGQTMDQVKENVRKRALELDIPHLSLYGLILGHPRSL